MSDSGLINTQYRGVLCWERQGDAHGQSLERRHNDAYLAWFFPLGAMEIAHGATLVVGDEQIALLVNHGQIADLFRAGIHLLTRQALPVLASLKNWDRSAESPFRADVCFFNLRPQTQRPWTTAQAFTIASRDFGAIALRAGGSVSYRLTDASRFFGEIDTAHKSCTRQQAEARLLELILSAMAHTFATTSVAFLDLAADLSLLGRLVHDDLAGAFHRLGFLLDDFCITALTLPDELQQAVDVRLDMPAPQTIGGVWLDSILQWQGAPERPD